jgi:hypothetical protein
MHDRCAWLAATIDELVENAERLESAEIEELVELIVRVTLDMERGNFAKPKAIEC